MSVPALAQAAPPQESTAMHESTPDASLSAKQQSIPVISARAASGDVAGLRVALNRGLDAGLSINEAKEVLVQLYAYAGFPRSLNALGELMKVVEDREQRGLHDVAGPEPGRPIASGEELLRVGRENQSRISGGPVDGPVFQFAPVINQYLQAHLFGAIFERDNLSWENRELATVGILSTMPDVTPQLRSHIAASLRVGLSVAQLRELIRSLAAAGMPDASKRAEAALEWHLAQNEAAQ